MMEEQCAICFVNYVRATCDDCGARICLHCAKGISDTKIRCENCQSEFLADILIKFESEVI